MSILWINASFRQGSRTRLLAERYLKESGKERDVVERNLGSINPPYLNSERIATYCEAVSNKDYSDPIFSIPKEFIEAEEILISAPFWNFTLPAVLHAYLEMVCTQGITFDMALDGSYIRCCKARKLTFICTAGGKIPERDHTYEYIKDLNNNFWGIPELSYICAEELDIDGTNVEDALEKALKEQRKS